MHIHPLEKKWALVALGMAGVFVGAIMISSVFHHIDTPGHVETIDSARLHLSQEFNEDNLGVQTGQDGHITVRMVAGRYGFSPRHITVPAQTPITFRWVSQDVLHGVHITMTNMSTMIVPGYVAEVTTILQRPGDYPVICNEYCGMGHAHMWSEITVIDKQKWADSKPAGVQHG